MRAIFWMTWKEMLRKKVLLITIVMTVLFFIAFSLIARAISGELAAEAGRSGVSLLLPQFEAGAIILSFGFFFGSFVVAFLAIFSSVSVISGEAEQGELQALLSRPLTRKAWYCGRWLGFVSIGCLYAALLFTGITSIAEFYATVPGTIGTQLIALLLFASTVPLLVSLSMVGSSYLSPMGNGVFMMMLYGTSWLGGMLEKAMGGGLFADTREKLELITGFMSMVMPADALQRRMLAELLAVREIMSLTDLDLGPFGFGQIPSNTFLLYALCYTAAVLFLGMSKFQRKDL